MKRWKWKGTQLSLQFLYASANSPHGLLASQGWLFCYQVLQQRHCACRPLQGTMVRFRTRASCLRLVVGTQEMPQMAVLREAILGKMPGAESISHHVVRVWCSSKVPLLHVPVSDLLFLRKSAATKTTVKEELVVDTPQNSITYYLCVQAYFQSFPIQAWASFCSSTVHYLIRVPVLTYKLQKAVLNSGYSRGRWSWAWGGNPSLIQLSWSGQLSAFMWGW